MRPRPCVSGMRGHRADDRRVSVHWGAMAVEHRRARHHWPTQSHPVPAIAHNRSPNERCFQCGNRSRPVLPIESRRPSLDVHACLPARRRAARTTARRGHGAQGRTTHRLFMPSRHIETACAGGRVITGDGAQDVLPKHAKKKRVRQSALDALSIPAGIAADDQGLFDSNRSRICFFSVDDTVGCG